jgi:hypothetical protein
MGLSVHQLRFAWLTVTAMFSAPLRYFERRTAAKRQHELALVEAQAAAQAKVFGAIAEANVAAIRELAGPLQENAKVLTTWLEGFKTTTIPTAQTVTEAAEMGWEADAAREVLERQKLEDAEMLRQAWPSEDGRPAPPVFPDFLS